MAAIMTVLSLFRTGDEWIVSRDLYGGTYRLLEKAVENWGLKVKYLQTEEPEQIRTEITEKTKAIFFRKPRPIRSWKKPILERWLKSPANTDCY